MKLCERMNINKQHNVFLSQRRGVAKIFFFASLRLCVSILFFASPLFSQTSDSTIQALEKRIQILEQKILQLEYLISTKTDSMMKVENKKEDDNSSVVEKKEEFVQCAAKTAKGTRCTRRAKTGNKFCGLHQFEGEPKKKK